MGLAFLVASPWWLLAVGMFVDEFYFHYKRGLPRWERIGHPVDTAGVLACLLLALAAPATGGWLKIYGLLCLASMALITKDEAVHAEKCGGGESWLHAVLFMLHPLALISAALAWFAPSGRLDPFGLGPSDAAFLRGALKAQAALCAGFCVYQVVYWNFLWNPFNGTIPASTTASTTS
jgi:hypothetical protein